MHTIFDQGAQLAAGITVILVDDESIILNGLASMLRKRFPQLGLVCTTNGYDALRLIAEQVPDLLITDVFMPQISGIDLIEKARDLGCRNYAVLTGFNEFEPAQKAVKLQAIDYLLKPVNKEELFALVETVARKRYEQQEQEFSQLEKALRLATIYDIPESQRMVQDKFPNSAAMLALFDDTESAEKAAAVLRLRCGREYDFGTVEESTGKSLRLWIHDAAAEELEECRRTLLEAAHARVACGSLNEISLHTLYQAILSGLNSCADDGLDVDSRRGSVVFTGIQKLLDLPQVPVPGCSTLIAEYAEAEDLALPIWKAVEAAVWLNTLPRSERQAAFQDWFAGLQKKAHPSSNVVLRSLEYILIHLYREINLSEVAQAVFLQPNYFSTLFHNDTGMTFVQYVNYMRVSLACQKLLVDINTSVEQVAHECGFDNLCYFYRIFKRLTMYTPGDFRKLFTV